VDAGSSTNPGAPPLLLVHGWPGSIFEFVKVIGPLSDPLAHRGDEADAFHVVSPSIPGYGFSGPTVAPGWDPGHIASAFAVLMERLGYDRYGAGGGDWGAILTTELARADEGRHMCGLHLTMPLGEPPQDADRDEVLSEADQKALEDWAAHQANGTVVHVPINSTRPHTLAFALNDSPAGLGAWLVDKFRSYSDCDGDVERSFTRDELLAEITTCWVTGTIASASRLYDPHVHEPELRVDHIRVVVQTLPLPAEELQATAAVTAADLEAPARLDRADQTDDPLGDPVGLGDRLRQLVLVLGAVAGLDVIERDHWSTGVGRQLPGVVGDPLRRGLRVAREVLERDALSPQEAAGPVLLVQGAEMTLEDHPVEHRQAATDPTPVPCA
jgi:pimeloyl-ACP methyl ester carboxylesterase